MAFLVLCIIPILAKWVLIGRWKPQQIRIWSLAYVRFWIVKTLVRSNPLALTVRRLAAVCALSEGAGCEDRTRGRDPLPHVPVCTDLLTIGAGTVIRKDSFFHCYRAHAGRIETGTVTIGRDVFIGEKTVLDIDTSMGDGAQTRSRLRAAQRAGHTRRRAMARVSGTAHGGELPEGRAGPLRHAAPGQFQHPHPAQPCSSCTCRWPKEACTCC